MTCNRLKKAREFFSLTVNSFAEKMDIPYRTVQNYEHGRSLPGGGYLTKLRELFNINPLWILTGESVMFVEGTLLEVPSWGKISPGIGKRIVKAYEIKGMICETCLLEAGINAKNIEPVINDERLPEAQMLEAVVAHTQIDRKSLAFGDGQFSEKYTAVEVAYCSNVTDIIPAARHEAIEKFWLDKVVALKPDNKVVIKVVEDSMSPTIRSGDLILADLSPKKITALYPDMLYIIKLDSLFLIKRFSGKIGDTLKFTSDNKTCSNYVLDLSNDKNQIMGVVESIVTRKLYPYGD